MSDAAGNFVSENLNIEQAISSSYNHQYKEQPETCIKFIKWTFEKCLKTNTDTYLALLQIR